MNHVGYTFILCPVFQGGQAIPDHRRNDRGLLFILWQQKDPGLGSYLETPETGQMLESKSFYPFGGMRPGGHWRGIWARRWAAGPFSARCVARARAASGSKTL